MQGSFASRMSHSCTPNCQAIPMRAGNRLTIALYTLRHINPGEELTFDYSCVTESEREFRAAVCLCGTTACRGSFLYYAGSKAYMQVPRWNLFYSFLFYSILLYSILFYSILLYSILFYSILLCLIWSSHLQIPKNTLANLTWRWEG